MNKHGALCHLWKTRLLQKSTVAQDENKFEDDAGAKQV